MARRYEFYVRVARTIRSHSFAVLTREILFLPREHKIISSSYCVMFFLLYRHTDDGVFDDFPKISNYFPKISQNCFEGQTNVSEHFPKNF